MSFISDGSRFAYSCKRDGHWYFVVDGVESEPYHDVGNHTILFSPNSRQLAYFGIRNGKWISVLDGKEGDSYDGMIKQSKAFSPDGEHISFLAIINDEKNPRKKHVILLTDGKQRGIAWNWLGLTIPRYSPDKKHIAFSFYSSRSKRNPKGFVVVDAKQTYGPYNMIAKGSIVFSRDGDHVAYCVLEKKRWKKVKGHIMVDGAEVKTTFEYVLHPVIFNPDGKSVIYRAFENGAWSVAVEGVAGPFTFDRLLQGSTIVFDTRDQFHYLAVKDSRIYLVEETTKKW